MSMKPNLYKYKGEEHSIREWARLYDVSPNALAGRLRKGLSMDKALHDPLLGRPKRGINLCNPAICSRCKYHELVDNKPICFYLVFVGERRPCPAGQCTVFEEKGKEDRYKWEGL